jgi:glycosyltransferase involved in cell wall biosynthesis
VKIIQILPELNAGGVERGTLELGKFLVDHGHQSIVISNGGRLVPQLEAEGSRHITLPVHKKRLRSLAQIKVLRRILETEQPDILHLRSRMPAWLAYLAWRKLDPQTRPRLVTTVHGFYSVNAYSKIMTRGERVICVSNSVRDYVLKNYPDVPAEKLTVIHRGVDPAQYHPAYRPDPAWLNRWQHEHPQLNGKFLITLPGRITRLKGHHDLMEILARLPENAHGLIAGGAAPRKEDYLAELKTATRERGLTQRLHFLGHRNDLREILAISDVVLSLTQKPESFGRTTLEALCLGTPVLGYDHGGVGEILDCIFPQGKICLCDTQTAAERVMAWRTQTIKPSTTNSFTLEQMLSFTLRLYIDLFSKEPPTPRN